MGTHPHRILAVTVLTGTLIGPGIPAGAALAGQRHTPAAHITQPAPPVTARAFRIEPAGTVPSDGDGRIPNPATPDGSPVAAPSACTVAFASGNGATSASVNAWIAAHQNRIRATTVVCLAGTFRSPVHIWGKTSTALLELAPAPGGSATLALGQAKPADINPNEFFGDAGGVSIVDSRSVEIYGLTVSGYTAHSPALSPAGIYVTARSDGARHESACFRHRGACSDIYLIRNTVRDVTNTADRFPAPRSLCGNSSVSAYGIAVIAAGPGTAPALQHVVLEDNTVTGTRTGQSETVTINGNVTDFLAARNNIHDVDNIGLDTIGWETGRSQASHGYLDANTVYNVDTWSNASYGSWRGGICHPAQENAAGIYDDGGAYIWINHNTVYNTNQGINLDVETPHRTTSHLLVSGNAVYDSPGTSQSDPSTGVNPPGEPGRSTVAGHDPFGLYIDAFGADSSIADVYVHDNTIRDQSQHALGETSNGAPSADLGGRWSNVQIWHNVISGMGAGDRLNPLFEVDQQPSSGTAVVDCNNYTRLSTSATTVNGNFALPTRNWLTLASWQAHNGHAWDTHSAVAHYSPACPAHSIP